MVAGVTFHQKDGGALFSFVGVIGYVCDGSAKFAERSLGEANAILFLTRSAHVEHKDGSASRFSGREEHEVGEVHQ